MGQNEILKPEGVVGYKYISPLIDIKNMVIGDNSWVTTRAFAKFFLEEAYPFDLWFAHLKIEGECASATTITLDVNNNISAIADGIQFKNIINQIIAGGGSASLKAGTGICVKNTGTIYILVQYNSSDTNMGVNGLVELEHKPVILLPDYL